MNRPRNVLAWQSPFLDAALSRFRRTPWGELQQAGNKGWETVPVPTAEPVDAFGASEDGTLWVGCGSTAWRLEGNAWTAFPLPVGSQLCALWVSSANEALAAALSGAIFRFDGSGWVEIRAARTLSYVSELWCRGASEVWAKTSEGLLRYRGQSWDRVEALDMEQLFDVRA